MCIRDRDIVLRDAGTELVLVGWDLCINEYLFTEEDLKRLRETESETARFCLDINHNLVELNERRFGAPVLDFADPVAMAVALEPDLVEQSVTAVSYTQLPTPWWRWTMASAWCISISCSSPR